MQILVFRIVNIQITFVKLITSYTNLSSLKRDTHSSLQTLIHLTRTLLILAFRPNLCLFQWIKTCSTRFLYH